MPTPGRWLSTGGTGVSAALFRIFNVLEPIWIFVLQFHLFCERSCAGLPGNLFCIFHIRSALLHDLKQAGDSEVDRCQARRVVTKEEHMYHYYTIAGAVSHGSTEAAAWDVKS